MTSKALNKYSPSVHNGYWNIKTCRKYSLIFLLLHLLGAPAMLINMMYNITNHISNTPSESVLYIAGGATALAGALGIIVAFTNFRYLFNKNQVDMSLSAPLSMKQRFLSDYLSGLVSYILPFLASQIPSVILFAVGLIGYDGHEFTLLKTNSLGEEWLSPYICESFGKALPAYGRLFIGGILLMIMLYTLTVLVTVCSGTLFDAVAQTILLNGAIPAFLIILFERVFRERFMLDFSKPYLHILSWTSPAGGLLMLICGIGYENVYDYSAVPILSWAAGVIVFSAAVFALAYCFYKKRRAEDVSKPLVFRGVYAVMITLMLFTAEIIFFGPDMDMIKQFDKYFFGVLAVGFGIYMLFEIISNRGLKKLWRGAVRFVSTLAVFLICINVINTTRCFGAEFNMPEADEVETVYLGYGGVYNEFPNISFTYFGADEAWGAFVIKDRNNIENILNAQNDIIAAMKEALGNNKDKDDLYNGYWENILLDSDVPYAYTYLTACHELKSGIRQTKCFPVMTAEAVRCLMNVETSEEYKVQAAEFIKEDFPPYDELAESRKTQAEFMGKADDPEQRGVYIYVSDPLNNVVYQAMVDKRIKKFVDKGFYEEFRDALAADIVNRTAAEYLTPCTERSYNIYISGLASWEIDGSFTETLKVLAEHGCLDGIEADIDYILDEENYINGSIPKMSITISENTFDNSVSRVLHCQKIGMSNTEYFDKYVLDKGRYVIHYSDELKELFSVMQSKYVTDELCYTISLNGNSFIIPPEYSEIAEKVFLSSEDKDKYAENTSLYYGIGAAVE